MNNIFILLGPTASGKSRLSQKLADEFSFEIINADLYSIYKGLDIGTAKPSKEALIKNKHHLIDKLEPTDEYNVSKYCHDVNKCINEITSLNKTPLITGGSMMYVYQLLNGLSHQYSICDTDLKIIKYILIEYTNKQIIDAITFAQEFNIDLVIVGGYDAPKTTSLLKKHQIPVLSCFFVR